MRRPNHRARFVALVMGLMFLGSIFVPTVQAQTATNVQSVGELNVDAQGAVSGTNLQADLTEADGVLHGFTSLALDSELFTSVSIDGFQQAEKLRGVGSSSIMLRGSNAVVSVYDNINSAVKIQATQDTEVTYDLAQDAQAEAASDHVVHLRSANDAYLGSIVLVGASAQDELTAESGEVTADVSESSSVVFRAKPVYVNQQAYTDAVVTAMAEGQLASEIVTEFDASQHAMSRVDYRDDVTTRTAAEAGGGVETDVRSRTSSSAVVAYDLAYETLSVDTTENVAVYVDGELATRAESASDVRAHAAAGQAAYHAFQADGRTQALVSTGSFQTAAEHTVSVVSSANADARTEAQARAEARSQAQSRVEGDYELHAGGKLTGSFSTAVVSEAEGSVESYTVLDTRTEVFTNAHVEGNSDAQMHAESGSRVVVDGPQARMTLQDDVHASFIVEAKADAEASFDLAADVEARAESQHVVHLQGPNGFTGSMVLVQADGSAASESRLETTADGSVKAHLQQDAQVVFRTSARAQADAEARAHASEEVVARAIAQGKVGAQVTTGFEANAATSTHTEYYNTVHLETTAEARGEYDFVYQADADAGSSFVVDSRGTSLSAKTASDIKVYVDGEAAAQVTSADAALNAEGYAAYYVDTSMSAQTRVVVNADVAAGAQADVKIVSKVDLAARAAANADAFGQFKIFYDGTAVGSYVTLRTDVEAGVVSDFTMASTGTTVFSSVKAGSSSFVSSGADGSTRLTLENEETTVVVTDTTSAYLKAVAKAETDVDFRAGGDVDATIVSENVVELTSENGAYLGSMVITNVEGRAAADSHFEVDGPDVRAHLEQNAQVVFRTHVGIETELSATQRTMINHAVATGNVGGQVLVQTQESLSARAHSESQAAARTTAEARGHASATAKAQAESVSTAHAEASGRVTTAITASYYNDVQLVTAATKDRVEITASSTTSAGKTIIVSLDPSTIEGMSQGEAQILVDGQAAAQASSYADILNPNDDDGEDEYFVLAGDAGVQVLVSLAHFSTRTVTLQSQETSSPPMFMYATMFLGVLVAAETALLVRARRD